MMLLAAQFVASHRNSRRNPRRILVANPTQTRNGSLKYNTSQIDSNKAGDNSKISDGLNKKGGSLQCADDMAL